MEAKRRDVTIRKKILREIADIEAFIANETEESFEQSRLAQKAVMMTLINIAELSKSFSEEYLLETNSIPWKEIRGLRNIAAHQYEIIRPANIWLTITQDVPALKNELLAHLPEENP